MPAPVREDTQPWYRQFWPWFLISIPALTIVGAIITINLAISGKDDLVNDDYYKEGLAVNRNLAKEAIAKQLGLNAQVIYNADSGQIMLQLKQAAVGDINRLHLVLTHPTKAEFDRKLILNSDQQGQFSGQVSKLEAANWQLIAEPEAGNWRIKGRLQIPRQSETVLN